MKIFSFVALLLVSSCFYAGAQNNRCSYVPPHEADNWLFFQNAGIKFTESGVVANHPVIDNLPAGKGTAAISDANGQLLLYTDGMKVWNRNHANINFGPNLSGDLGSTQSSLIVPKPGSPQMFYIFTTDLVVPPAFGTTKGLNYSRVDVSINNNYGAVTDDRNIQLLTQTAEMITGVKHANGRDYWVVAHGLDDNSFQAFLVDTSGVRVDAVVTSYQGSSLSSVYNDREYLGAMKISPKGDKIAFASFGKKIVELFSFNNATGQVSNGITLYPPVNTDQGPYYVEFSPDGSKLYYTVANLSTGRQNYLYQFDISAGGNEQPLNPAPMESDVSALQSGRDGKIYVSRYQQNWLGVIENPNRPGFACNYNQQGLSLGSKKSQNGFSNFIQSFFDVPYFDYDTKCMNDETEFWLLNESNIDAVEWDFGDEADPTPGSGFNPVHVYKNPGIYDVKVTETYGSVSYITHSQVIINALPPKSFENKGDSLYLFPGSMIPLDAGEGMHSYLWQDGSDGQFYDVSDPGLIVVNVEDINCCKSSDSLRIISLAITLPSAFSPNGDGLNDTFGPIGPDEGISDFSLKVFNRWGQKVWEAISLKDEWNGTFNGQISPSGIYSWQMSFNVIGNISFTGKAQYKGNVTILR